MIAGGRAAGHNKQEHREDYCRHNGQGTPFILRVRNEPK